MPGATSPWPLLKDPTVAPLFLARLVSCAGVGFGQIALAWGVMDMGYGARGLSIVLACNSIPALLIIFGGIAGDRFPRHQVLVVAEIIAFTAWLVLGISFATNQAPFSFICVLATIAGIALAIFLPTIRGIIADLLPSENRPAGNALIDQTQSAGLLIGLLTSGLLVATAGPGWAASARGILCGIGAILLSRLNTQRPQQTTGLQRELCEGWQEFLTYPWVWIMTLHYTAVTIALVCYLKIAGPLYTSHGNGGAWAWGVINSCEALGALLGGLVGALWRPSRAIFIAAFTLVFASLPMLLMGSGSPWPLLALITVISGVSQAIYYVFWTTTLQETFPSEVLARVNGWNIIASCVLMPVTLLTAGPLVKSFGPEIVALTSGCLIIIATLTTLIFLRSTLRTPTAPKTYREQLQSLSSSP
ncbi:MFS transporter [Actinomadura xylanilytica]|uniref:MFS transporter n=1 Tax=Actinomadura xylanilytica TaxID=887459 RepID=UPI00255B2EB0|nr:MFS transporter [Actinomadura xylanilytica]MDL4770695.1 MFS transporter [Actinomadura xylanilytica]